MFGRIKKRLKAWVEEVQQHEITRLLEENTRLKREIEQETGLPMQLTPEERSRLVELSKRMDPETLNSISVFGPEQVAATRDEKESAENS